MSDLDRILQAEELTLAKENEINRVLSVCPYDYFAILEINPAVNPDTLSNRIKKIYRKKTLLLHPDKVLHVKAPEAFDRLKKAETVLSLDSAGEDAESKSLFQEKQNLIAIYNSVQGEEVVDSFNDPQNAVIRKKVAAILEDQMQEEEIEKKFQQRQEEQRQNELKQLQKERELKKKLASQWEDDRDKRVNNWRSYTNKVTKKKKKKKVLV